MIPLLLLLTLYFNAGYGLIMPMTKPDGTLDVSSLLSHISLLEQSIESKASSSEVTAEITNLKTQLNTALSDLKTAQLELMTTQTKLDATQKELGEVKSDLKTTQLKVAVLESQPKTVSQCSCNMSTSLLQPSTDMSSLKADVATLKTDVFHLQSQRNSTQQAGLISSGGTTFTRWGRTSCPNETKIVYKGYTGGSLYTNRASTATVLCLPDHPIYVAQTTGSWHSSIYGTEYETGQSGDPFQSLQDEDMPCVVCESDTRDSTIMVPARNQCYPGWHLEFWGYLMGAHDIHASNEYICVDKTPEAITGGQEDKNGHVMYIVESFCGSLPCPPYNNGSEVTCAVCTK